MERTEITKTPDGVIIKCYRRGSPYERPEVIVIREAQVEPPHGPQPQGENAGAAEASRQEGANDDYDIICHDPPVYAGQIKEEGNEGEGETSSGQGSAPQAPMRICRARGGRRPDRSNRRITRSRRIIQ